MKLNELLAQQSRAEGVEPVLLHNDDTYCSIGSGSTTYLLGRRGKCVVLHRPTGVDAASSELDSMSTATPELFPDLKTARYNLTQRW